MYFSFAISARHVQLSQGFVQNRLGGGGGGGEEEGGGGRRVGRRRGEEGEEGGGGEERRGEGGGGEEGRGGGGLQVGCEFASAKIKIELGTLRQHFVMHGVPPLGWAKHVAHYSYSPFLALRF